ncbi:MAG: transcription-repair coupling factor [Clostridia bacterium]|nr:transcription-repair coupling factor [Clostridia bacterium]
MNPLIANLTKYTKYNSLLEDIKKDKLDISVIGLTDSQKAHIVYSLVANSSKNACIICNNNTQAKKIMQDLKFYSEIEIIYFPARDIVYYDVDVQSREIQNQRLYAIHKIISGGSNIIVTTIDAVTQKMMPKSTYIDLDINVDMTSKINLKDFVLKLDRMGFKRASNVDGKGQFAIRGGLIDIFPTSSEKPYRIELFGEDIDSIRTFDPVTQRSVENVDNLSINYASEFPILNENIQSTINILNDLGVKENINSELKKQIDQDINILSEGNVEEVINKYFELLVPSTEYFLEYIEDYAVYIDEPVRCIQKSKNVCYENFETLKMLGEKNYIYLPYAFQYSSFEDIESNLKNMNNVYLERINTDKIMHSKRKEYIFISREVNFFRGSMDILMQDIQKWQKVNKRILLVFPSLNKVELIKNQLIDNAIKVTYIENISVIQELEESKVYITFGVLSGGFEYEDFNLCVICEPVSGVEYNTQKTKKKQTSGQIINSFEDLNVGDYVVHENHGIGVYRGIDAIQVGNIQKDYIKIEYLNNGILYVPISQLDSVKKYLCDDDFVPKLNSLGGKEWVKTKSKVRSYVQEIAKELIALYAKRSKTRGHSFSIDTPWQNEFEDNFKYELTDDQKTALTEVKSDMENEIPMDRLLCGDVGYGKTEVAIRAAFKSVMDSKQVAYLVPTTVLALQQYKSFKDRMETYGIRVEMLNRFRNKKEQKEILKGLVDGNIDVIIGTHRLLSKDVFFKDLGLLIIDEEHRFGVKAKEAIKTLKETIDVLSMTATPIPRTLHMSMIGIRQMSTLFTPPLERIPVHTYVLEYNDDLIKEAIEKELARDGQVFYINNRVDNIENICNKVRNLVGEARVAYAHGQMDPDEIEDIMVKFMNHELDVIVCTTILESGIDIPNANTIIIENADKLGLAQLYQIRGRVGRSNRLSYAYITYEKNKQISEVAEKRLKAIKDFTEFGSGFKIALRDLEIRGAGNLLGKEQHGHMASVGYELYLAMLERAINEEKLGAGDKKEDLSDALKDVKIDIDVSAYISDNYIPDITQKISIYQKISNIESNEESMNIIDELLDRFGNIPKETENLIKIVEVRNECRKLNITRVVQKQDYIVFEPTNLKFRLTNNANNDILFTVQLALKKIRKLLEKKEN